MGWDKNYTELTERNLGMVTEKEQERLKNACFAVFGMGGLGGVISEVLCRAGVGHLKIIDFSEFEPSNLNRQIYCFRSTMGMKKIDAAEKFLLDINPDLKLEKYLHDNSDNIDEILKGVDVAMLAVDKARACLLISRETKKRGIPMVESWAVPYSIVRVYTKDTMSMEEAYKLSTIGKKIEDLTQDEIFKIGVQMLTSLRTVEGAARYYTKEVVDKIMGNRNPTFAPFVWQNAVAMCVEAFKVFFGWGNVSLAPRFGMYDPISQKIPKQA